MVEKSKAIMGYQVPLKPKDSNNSMIVLETLSSESAESLGSGARAIIVIEVRWDDGNLGKLTLLIPLDRVWAYKISSLCKIDLYGHMQ